YALETTLVGLLVCAFGAIAGVVIAPEGTTDVVAALASGLVSSDNRVAGFASVLFAIFVLSATLSTMSGLLAAGLCTLRFDVLGPGPGVATTRDPAAASEATARQRTLIAGLAGLV